jgi:3-phosphoshikimate 1-carboxyvinyltransferase
LNEKPYVEMTLSYLKAQGLFGGVASGGSGKGAAADSGQDLPGIVFAAEDFSFFRINGGAQYRSINGPVPGDFSSAAFPAAAAAVSGGSLTLLGLDPHDTQGDKVFFEYLAAMGCGVKWEAESPAAADSPAENPAEGAGADKGWKLTVSSSGPLRGGSFDLNATPDMLPVMAVLAACAEGRSALTNAAHARIKETDRIAAMAEELGKLGISCRERPDGLLIEGRGRPGLLRPDFPQAGPQAETASAGAKPSPPVGSRSGLVLDGRGDHRIVMALACAVLGLAAGPAEITGAEAADVTYPGFLELLKAREYT